MTEVPEKPLIEPVEFHVRAVLTGKSPLVMHNGLLADPDNEYTRQIDEIVAKKKDMTAEDRSRKEALQWRGSLYTEEVKEGGETEPRERIVVPWVNLFRCLEAGGKALGQGTKSKGAAVVRSITPTETYMILGYDGPSGIAELAAERRFRWRTIINPNPTAGSKRKLPSVRPIFPEWQLETAVHVVTDMGLSWEDFERAFRAAGNIGLCDALKLGYGRFRVRLTKLR